MTPEVLALLAKLVGALIGAFLALVFQPPKTRAEFVTRSVFSVFAGFVFSTPVREYLKWIPTLEMELASSALTALLAWYIMGAVVRIVGGWKPK